MQQPGAHVVDLVTSSSTEPDEEVEVDDEEAKSSDCILSTNNNGNGNKANTSKKNHEDEDEGEGEGVKKRKGNSYCCFPVSRIKRLIKSEAADFRTTQDAVFLINKATEQFLQLFAEDAFTSAAASAQSLTYQNLASVVSNRRRYEFLSDFVPEKLRAKDALSEKASAGA